MIPPAFRCCFPTITTSPFQTSCCCTSLRVVLVVVPLSASLWLLYPLRRFFRLSSWVPLASLLDWALLRCLLALLRGASCIGRLSLERGYLTGGNPIVILTTFPHLLLFWAGACKNSRYGPVSRLRESGVSAQRAGGRATSPSSGFATSGWCRKNRLHLVCHHHFGHSTFSRQSIFNSLSASPFQFGSTSQTSSGSLLSLFLRTHIHIPCCGVPSFYRFFPTLPNPVYVSISDFFTPFSFIACH